MYNITISPNASGDLDYIRKYDRTRIIKNIYNILSIDPVTLTNEKRVLRPTQIAERELKISNFRAFYTVNETTKEVDVISVGWKEHNKLFIRGKETQI
jgi:mRNA-degrading endonuclease RelE of RelBE toxin-antitoxin system